jgi:hypothetical protein
VEGGEAVGIEKEFFVIFFITLEHFYLRSHVARRGKRREQTFVGGGWCGKADYVLRRGNRRDKRLWMIKSPPNNPEDNDTNLDS